MGADGGGEEGGPDVDDGPPGVGDLGGRGGFLLAAQAGLLAARKASTACGQWPSAAE